MPDPFSTYRREALTARILLPPLVVGRSSADDPKILRQQFLGGERFQLGANGSDRMLDFGQFALGRCLAQTRSGQSFLEFAEPFGLLARLLG
jgi:hypothetical protein